MFPGTPADFGLRGMAGSSPQAEPPAPLPAISDLWAIYRSYDKHYQDVARTQRALSGHSIGSLSDLSGNERHLSQATADNRPVLQPSIINGQPVIRSDGSNDLLQSGSTGAPLATSSFTVFAAFRFWSVATGFDTFWRWGDETNGEKRYLYLTTTQTNFGLFNSNLTANFSSDDGQLRLVCIRWQATDGATNIYVDDMVNAKNGGFPFSAQYSDRVFSLFNEPGLGNCCAVDLAELAIYTRYLPEADRTTFKNYITDRFGSLGV